MGNDTKIRKGPKGPKKIPALITYIIALIALALGLFLPFSGTGTGAAGMLGLQLPSALNQIVHITALDSIAAKYPFASACVITIGSFSLSIDAILCLLYALIFVAGIVALIPIIVNVANKRARKNTALRAASFIEVLAFIVLSCLMFFALNNVDAIHAFNNWALLAAFGGVTVILIVQAIIHRKGSGLIKFLLFLVSAITLTFTVYYDKIILPLLGDKIPTFGGFSMGLYGQVSALSLANTVFNGFEVSALSIVGIIVTYLVFLNFVLDGMGLGKRTNRGMLIANVVRFALQIVAAAVLIILSVVNKEVEIGLLTIIIAALGLVELILNIIRLVAYKTPKQRAQARREKDIAKAEKADGKESKKQAKQREKEERKAREEAEKAARLNVVAEEAKDETAADSEAPSLFTKDVNGNIVYNPIIYNGPKDEFISSLPNEQQLEFSRVFLERQVGAITFIPDYVVNGNNDRFFKTIFIYHGRLIGLVSGGLMNSFFKQVNVMK